MENALHQLTPKITVGTALRGWIKPEDLQAARDEGLFLTQCNVFSLQTLKAVVSESLPLFSPYPARLHTQILSQAPVDHKLGRPKVYGSEVNQ